VASRGSEKKEQESDSETHFPNDDCSAENWQVAAPADLVQRDITDCSSRSYETSRTIFVAIPGASRYNEIAFDFRVPSQYMHLRLTQRVTCLQKNP
jgi:hypothetical protein